MKSNSWALLIAVHAHLGTQNKKTPFLHSPKSVAKGNAKGGQGTSNLSR